MVVVGDVSPPSRVCVVRSWLALVFVSTVEKGANFTHTVFSKAISAAFCLFLPPSDLPSIQWTPIHCL
jgi:hypothetical protein